MASDTEAVRLSDVVKYEADPTYTRERIYVDKDISVVIGEPLDRNGHASGPPAVASKIANGSEANADAISLEAHATASADYQILALVRGPAVVDGDQLTLQTSVTVAEMQTNLLANIDVVVQTDPTNSETQTT